MEGYKFNRKDIIGNLAILRDQLRDGKTTVDWTVPNILRIVVAQSFGIEPSDFSTQYFDERTLARFANFFAIPGAALRAEGKWRHPTLDETAWAIQNFMNRRQEVWSSYANKMRARQAVDAAAESVDQRINEALENL